MNKGQFLAAAMASVSLTTLVLALTTAAIA